MIQFSPEAMKKFNEIPDHIKEKILSNVFCGHCRAMVRIVKFSARMEGNDLILEGQCEKCSGKVARLIEGA